MTKIIAAFSVKAQSIFETTGFGNVKSTLKTTEFDLDVSDNLDYNQYATREPDGTLNLTEAGHKSVTTVLVTNLVANIHNAHDKGIIDSAVHLREIIAELEKGFVVVSHENKGPQEFTDLSQIK